MNYLQDIVAKIRRARELVIVDAEGLRHECKRLFAHLPQDALSNGFEGTHVKNCTPDSGSAPMLSEGTPQWKLRNSSNLVDAFFEMEKNKKAAFSANAYFVFVMKGSKVDFEGNDAMSCCFSAPLTKFKGVVLYICPILEESRRETKLVRRNAGSTRATKQIKLKTCRRSARQYAPQYVAPAPIEEDSVHVENNEWKHAHCQNDDLLIRFLLSQTTTRDTQVKTTVYSTNRIYGSEKEYAHKLSDHIIIPETWDDPSFSSIPPFVLFIISGESGASEGAIPFSASLIRELAQSIQPRFTGPLRNFGYQDLWERADGIDVAKACMPKMQIMDGVETIEASLPYFLQQLKYRAGRHVVSKEDLAKWRSASGAPPQGMLPTAEPHPHGIKAPRSLSALTRSHLYARAFFRNSVATIVANPLLTCLFTITLEESNYFHAGVAPDDAEKHLKGALGEFLQSFIRLARKLGVPKTEIRSALDAAVHEWIEELLPNHDVLAEARTAVLSYFDEHHNYKYLTFLGNQCLVDRLRDLERPNRGVEPSRETALASLIYDFHLVYPSDRHSDVARKFEGILLEAGVSPPLKQQLYEAFGRAKSSGAL